MSYDTIYLTSSPIAYEPLLIPSPPKNLGVYLVFSEEIVSVVMRLSWGTYLGKDTLRGLLRALRILFLIFFYRLSFL